MDFFRLHPEKRIGLKKLTDADLGLSNSSRQTHIGLYEGVLEYLEDSDVIKKGLLVYKNNCFVLDCYFDRIATPNGGFRSPKIRKGPMAKESVVDKIRAIAKDSQETDWFLIWSGLESGQIVFWLMNKKSKDYKEIKENVIHSIKILKENESCFNNVEKILLSRLNVSSYCVQKDIEVASQTGKNVKIYRPKDIEKADEIFKKIGRDGECLIASYLSLQKKKKKIRSYRWMNQNAESGEPFDFLINEGLESEKFIDVKSTRFDFDQYLYYSDGEIKFIDTLKDDNKYCVYRVFEIGTSNLMKICASCQEKISSIYEDINIFEQKIQHKAAILQNTKIGIKPSDCFSDIHSSIIRLKNE